MINKEAQKILRYSDLTIEIQHMWNTQAKAKPLKVGTTRTISKSFRKYMRNKSEKQKIKELKKKNIVYCSHHHHHHISVMQLGHLLTRSGLTYPEVSSKVCHNSFCQLENSVSLPWVIYYEAFCLHVVSIVYL